MNAHQKGLGLLVLLALGAASHGVPSAEDARFFAEKVAPLLEQRCFECHSHQAGKMKGGLTLDSRSGYKIRAEIERCGVPEPT